MSNNLNIKQLFCCLCFSKYKKAENQVGVLHFSGHVGINQNTSGKPFRELPSQLVTVTRKVNYIKYMWPQEMLNLISSVLPTSLPAHLQCGPVGSFLEDIIYLWKHLHVLLIILTFHFVISDTIRNEESTENNFYILIKYSQDCVVVHLKFQLKIHFPEIIPSLPTPDSDLFLLSVPSDG